MKILLLENSSYDHASKGLKSTAVLLSFQVLVSFGCGYCVVYDMKCNSNQVMKDAKVDAHKHFFYDPGHSHVS